MDRRKKYEVGGTVAPEGDEAFGINYTTAVQEDLNSEMKQQTLKDEDTQTFEHKMV